MSSMRNARRQPLLRTDTAAEGAAFSGLSGHPKLRGRYAKLAFKM